MAWNFQFWNNKSSSELKSRAICSPPGKDLILDERLDSQRIRSIWNNTEKDYKLSASVVICGIQALIDYVSYPEFQSSVKSDIKKEINRITKYDADTFNRKSFTEGNFYVWSNYNSKKKELEHIIFSHDEMYKIFFDIDTHELIAIKFKQTIKFLRPDSNEASTTRYIYFDDKSIITEYEGDIPTGKQRKSIFNHDLGIIPIKYWTFNKGNDEIEGHGLLEPCEPHMRILHDVMLNRAIEDRRSSRKKLSITGFNATDWIENTKSVNGISSEDSSIDLEEMEAFFNTVKSDGNKEEIKYLIPEQSASDSIQIAKLCFTNIIEILGVQEFVFPPKLGASFASVQAQVPRFVKRIESLRAQMELLWISQWEIDSVVMAKANLGKNASSIKAVWKRLDLESQELRAKIVNYMMSSMKIAKDEGLMDDEEIRNYLDSFMCQLKNDDEFKKGKKQMLADLEAVKKAFGAGKDVEQEGDKKIDNENRDKDEG